MKIGYVFTNLLLGGVQTLLADLAVAFSKIHEVRGTVLSMEKADPYMKDRIRNIKLVSTKELLDWCDIVHLDGMATHDQKKQFKPKWQCVIEAIGSARNFTFAERVFRKGLPPYLISMSQYISRSLRTKNRVIYAAVDTDKFRPIACEKKYDLVMIGRMRPVKNHELFLEICRKGNFSFLTIGGTHRRGHMNDIEKKVRNQAVEGRDYVAGFVPNEEVVPLLNQAKMAVVTSHSEALGFNSMEPMACGVPVVCRDVDGTSEVHGKESDLLVPYDAPADVYVEKIKKYIDDVTLRKKVRERIVEKFSFKKSFEEHQKLYEEIHKK